MQTLSLGGYQFDPVLAAALGKKALIIAIILIVTWLLAKAAKWSFAKLVDRAPLFQRAAASGESVGAALGRIVSLFIWLFGLVAILQALDLNSAISKTIGTIVFILIIVPVGIAALDVLDIPSITGPAKAMLEMVLSAVPLIIGASLVLGLGYVIARWVGSMIEEVLPGLGFDRSVEAIGIVPEGRSASGVVATISQVAIMLFMAVAATRLLGFPELTAIVETVLEQGASVIFGAVLIAAGVILARVLRGLVAAAAGEGIAPSLVHWLTVGLFVFIGLKQMNIGGQIVDYAFGAIAVGVAVAFALAVGLGGREVAAQKLGKLIN